MTDWGRGWRALAASYPKPKSQPTATNTRPMKTNAAIVPAKNTVQVEKLLAEERLKETRMQDVKLLLENLFEREEATVKQVLDCLLDVGSINLVNNKVGPRLLKAPVLSVARMSKPALRFVAIRWFKKNCPELIVNWLQTKIEFSKN